MRTLALLLALLGAASVAAQPFPFVEDTASPLVQAEGNGLVAFWGDLDGDSDLDLFISDAYEQDYLYWNEGGGAFDEVRFDGGPYREVNGGGWVDANRDGRLDLVTASLIRAALLLNIPGASPPLRPYVTVLDDRSNVRDIAVADYDRDGRPDGLVVRRFNVGHVLVRNIPRRGDVVSESEISQAFDNGSTACWGDLEGDGYPDLYIANGVGEANRLYRNDAGVLREVTGSPATEAKDWASEGCSFADYDTDGDLDLFVANVRIVNEQRLGAPNRLFRNDGGALTRVNAGPVTADEEPTFGSAWGDVDHDGDLDLAVSTQGAPDAFYTNDGAGGFTRSTFGEILDGRASAVTLVDDDEDGDLDLFVVNGSYDPTDEPRRLFRNTTDQLDDDTHHWLQVDLRGSASDRLGLGTRLHAWATLDGIPRMLVREVNGRPGRMAHDGFRVHFGLRDAAVVDSLVVDWPSGVRQVLRDVASDQILVVEEPNGMLASAALTMEANAFGAYEDEAAFYARASRVDSVGVTAEGVPDGLSSPSVAVTPNPAADHAAVALLLDTPAKVRLALYDVLGREVAAVEAGALEAGTHRLGLDLSVLPPGAYLWRLAAGSRIETGRLTVAR